MIKDIIAAKLRLKIVEKADSGKIHSLRTDRDVAKYITRDLNVSITDTERFIEERLSDSEHILFYKIETGTDLELAGTIVLKNIDRQRKCAEVGFELFPRFESQGLMTTALAEIVNMAFGNLGLKELEACTHSENLKSQKLLEKLKFKKTDKFDKEYPYNVTYRLKQAEM